MYSDPALTYYPYRVPDNPVTWSSINSSDPVINPTI